MTPLAMPSAKEFTAAKLRWLDLVLEDGNIPHLSFRLAYAIAGYVNRSTGDAWPSQKVLAARLGVTRRGIQKAIDPLVTCGHILATMGEGRGNTSRYRLAINGEPLFSLSEPKGRTAEHEKANGCSEKGERTFAQNTLKNTSKNTKEQKLDHLFELWFAIYPRKQGREEAREQYEEIITSGKATVDELNRAVVGFDRACWGTDPNYIPMPATWLKKGRWKDEPQFRREVMDGRI